MKQVKILGILLLACSSALARTTLEANIELEQDNYRSNLITTKIELDANQSAIVYQDDYLRIEARLIEERKTSAEVVYTITRKDGNDKYALVAAPRIIAEFNCLATISMDDKIESKYVFLPWLSAPDKLNRFIINLVATKA